MKNMSVSHRQLGGALNEMQEKKGGRSSSMFMCRRDGETQTEKEAERKTKRGKQREKEKRLSLNSREVTSGREEGQRA